MLKEAIVTESPKIAPTRVKPKVEPSRPTRKNKPWRPKRIEEMPNPQPKAEKIMFIKADTSNPIQGIETTFYVGNTKLVELFKFTNNIDKSPKVERDPKVNTYEFYTDTASNGKRYMMFVSLTGHPEQHLSFVNFDGDDKAEIEEV